MPAFGRDGILKRADIENVADYVRSLSGLPVDPKAGLVSDKDFAAGKKVFADTCAVCHGADGKGNRELGTPNLADPIWLYGSDKAAVVESIWNGRGGMMPAWAGRLDEVTIKALAVYVHSFGGGEK
jgi:cytochrome c oxidase cbb3-type subunit 3